MFHVEQSPQKTIKNSLNMKYEDNKNNFIDFILLIVGIIAVIIALCNGILLLE